MRIIEVDMDVFQVSVARGLAIFGGYLHSTLRYVVDISSIDSDDRTGVALDIQVSSLGVSLTSFDGYQAYISHSAPPR